MTRALPFVLLLLAAACSSARVGDLCQYQDQCDGLDRGYCAKVQLCTRSCSGSARCPSGADCVEAAGRRICLRTCEREEDCEFSQRCTLLSGERVCAVEDPYKVPFPVSD